MVLERDDDDEVGVARDLLKSLGHLKENCLAHHLLGGKNVSAVGLWILHFRSYQFLFKNSPKLFVPFQELKCSC